MDMLYVHDFICTYKLQEEEYQEDLYRTQFLQAFGLDTWNDETVEKRLRQLYESIKTLQDVKEIIEKAKTSEQLAMLLLFSGTNDDDVFKLLFKFELFDLTHRCICDALNDRKISKINKEYLLNNL